MKTATTTLLFAVALLFYLPEASRAEKGEVTTGLEGSLVLPGFKSQDSTAFALATWGVGGHAQVGLFEDLYLQGRGLFSAFPAELRTTRSHRGRDLDGVLRFSSTHVHVELGGRYKLYSGHNLAPYVEVLGGFLWSTYRDQAFVNEQGQSFGLDLADISESALTASAAFAVDYRLWNLFFIGAAVRYVHMFGGMYQRYVSVPLQVSYYW